ncbi:MAG: aminotransferase class V-fold PLP-dependent enzyme [Candidatus Pacebacteria bacterium]|nr:aminotransferase class V-fold PLP-dependent enzyme [Candidatus Paceibacterota bacterium]
MSRVFPDTLKIRDQFPIFRERPDLIFLDSASTTQKLGKAIDVITSFYTKENTNVGRSLSTLDVIAQRKIARIREQASVHIGAPTPESIFFSFGASHSMRGVTNMFFEQLLQDGDEILVSPSDHQSYVQPWYEVAAVYAALGKRVKIVELIVSKNGQIDWADLKSKVTARTRLVNLTHIHNVYGNASEILYNSEKIAFLKSRNIIIQVDGAQSLSKAVIDVEGMGIDVLHTSGHKAFAAQGVGVVFLRPTLFSNPGRLFEGTPHVAGIYSLGAFFDFAAEIGMAQIEAVVEEVTKYTYEGMRSIPSVVFTTGIAQCGCNSGNGILSFTLSGASSVEVGQYLNQHTIYVRSGTHCNFDPINIGDSVRVSVHAYTSKQDIDTYLDVLHTFSNAL